MAQKINVGTQGKIIAQIKDGILSGKYKPSQELDKRSFFIEKYNTTPITVQRAFNHLVDHGFVTTKSRLGTFAAINKKHHSVAVNMFGLLCCFVFEIDI
jgi:DNA-binding GntR family transcriptional regulator